MTEPDAVLADLAADAEELDRILTGLTNSQWRLATPAPGWSVAHQVAHLAATFRLAALAAADPTAFQQLTSELGDDFDSNVAAALARYLDNPPLTLLSRWQAERAAAVAALAKRRHDELVPWLVRPLPAAVLAAAGLMEVFAHGQDIVDAVGAERTPTDRLRHLVEFAVRTWDFGYQARGLTPPEVQFRYELTAPSGELWQFGPADAADRITGPAFDFCLLVTRRRHRADLALTATGTHGDQWLDIAQAYRGPAGAGRLPGQFAATVG